MRERVAWLTAMTLCWLAIVLAGCGGTSEIRTGGGGLRTFTVVHGPNGEPVLCNASAVAPHGLQGTFRGDAGAAEPVWLEAADGRHMSVIWPEGFAVRFLPDAVLYTERGVAVLRAGDQIELGQVSEGSAKGTFEDPYVAAGLAFGSCYVYLHG